MPQSPKQPINPFYVLLVIIGIAFSVTACAYGMMTVRAARSDTAQRGEATSGMVTFLDRHGASVMAGEIFLLAVATFAAMGTDRWQANRRKNSTQSSAAAQSPPRQERT